MLENIFAKFNLFKTGELDDLFLAMKDTLITINDNTEAIMQTNMPEIVYTLLEICKVSVQQGIEPNVCKTLINTKILQHVSTNTCSSTDMLALTTISSAIDIFYTNNIDGLYSMAYVFCSPEVTLELSKYTSANQYNQTPTLSKTMRVSAIITPNINT